MKAGAVALVVALSSIASVRDAPAQEVIPSEDDDAPPVVAAPPSDGTPPPAGAPPAAAPPAPTTALDLDAVFGAAGQITVSDDLQLAATQQSYDFQGQRIEVLTIALRPAVDFFATPNLSFGGQLVIGWTSVRSDGSASNSQVELGLFARVGYNFAFSSTSSIWPRVALGFRHISGNVGGDRTIDVVPLQIYVPIIFRPAAHFFIGGGPLVTTDLVSKPDDATVGRTTTIGLQSTLGGYFRGM